MRYKRETEVSFFDNSYNLDFHKRYTHIATCNQNKNFLYREEVPEMERQFYPT